MTNLTPTTNSTKATIWLKRLFSTAIALIILLIAISGLMTFFSAPPSVPHPLLQGYNTKALQYSQDDLDTAAGHLSQILSVPTLASSESNLKPFTIIQGYFQSHYPAFHALARRRIMSGGSILYHWPGTSPDLKPSLWLAHMDVTQTTDPKDWLFPPFSGAITDAGIWGRGSLGSKTNIVAMLEALDRLARTGFKPQRSLYLAFSHDAKSKDDGNKSIKTQMEKEGLNFSYILDEGGYVTERFLPNIEKDVAFVGIAEKKHIDIQLSKKNTNNTAEVKKVNADSTEIRETDTDLLNAASKLESHTFDADSILLKPVLNMLSPYLPFKHRWVLSNQWLLSPVINKHVRENPHLNNMISTKISVNELDSTNNENKIAVTASILPSEKTENLVKNIKEIIDNESIEVTALYEPTEESVITPTEGAPYQLLWQSIEQTYKHSNKNTDKAGSEIIVAPILQVKPSSSLYYQGLSQHILRFSFLPLSPETKPSITTIDEHISQQGLENAIVFYYFFAKNSLVKFD